MNETFSGRDHLTISAAIFYQYSTLGMLRAIQKKTIRGETRQKGSTMRPLNGDYFDSGDVTREPSLRHISLVTLRIDYRRYH